MTNGWLGLASPAAPTRSIPATVMKLRAFPPLPCRVLAAALLIFTVRAGAADPRGESQGQTVNGKPTGVTSNSDSGFWSYRKPIRHSIPITRNRDWARSDLDHYIVAELQRNRLTPSPDADPVTLLRRLFFDLIGLPPEPETAAAFAKAWPSADREKLLADTVDRLLASKEFGVRWGRHWLDVARFAESSGRESNVTFPHAWRYRDFVIDAINADIPFDRFITEQIAGDLLPAEDGAERARLLIATGFLAFGTKGLNEMNKAQFDADLVDEQIDTVTRAVMASSVACARCHDHKTDPFTMEDYYALAGVFVSTNTHFGASISSESNVASNLIRLPELPGQLIPNKSIPAAQVAKMKAQITALNEEEKAGQAAVRKALKAGRSTGGEFTLQDAIRIYWTRGGLEGQLKQVDDDGRALPLCMGTLDAAMITDARLLVRGEIAHPDKAIPRGFPQAIPLHGANLPAKNSSGRLELAQWLTHPDHPFTKRVFVNRVWRHLFGTGLVRTVDNFGASGEAPSHPELLDHLALRFGEKHGSLKALVREIVLSRTYRQSSAYRADCFERDPANRLLWRASKRRHDAEVIRDSMLFVSGQLDLTARPGSVIADLGDKSVSLFGFTKELPTDLDGMRRRSVYLPIARDRLPDVLELFDFAEPSLVTGDRDVTNVPMQALYLLNGPFVQKQAAALADRVLKEKQALPDQIQRAFQLCFNRQPQAAEAELAESFIKVARSSVDANPPDERQLMTTFCQSVLATAEFRTVD